MSVILHIFDTILFPSLLLPPPLPPHNPTFPCVKLLRLEKSDGTRLLGDPSGLDGKVVLNPHIRGNTWDKVLLVRKTGVKEGVKKLTTCVEREFPQ